MTGNDRQCERLLAIDLKRAEGLEISASEGALYERHLAECESCRAERKALGAMSDDAGAGPSEALDDIARRRYVDRVLERYDAPPSDARFTEPARRSVSRRLTFGVAGGLAAAAAIALVIAAAMQGGEGDARPDPGEAVDAAAYAGRVLLVAGDAAAFQPVVSDEPFEVGQAVTTGSGRTVLSLSTGITIAVLPESRVTIQRLDNEAMEVDLQGGSLVALVTPGREGPPFVVGTRHGAVTVTGTVFAVDDDGDDVEVRVIRGKVTIDDDVGEEPRPVGPTEATVLGRPAVRPARSDESAAAWKTISVFDLLDPGAGAIVDVRSIPAGADVVIDGVSLGRTPVVAAVRAGHRRLELTLEGREPVRELVDVLEGETVSRAFELAPVEPADVVALVDAGDGAEGAPAHEVEVDPAGLLTRAQDLRGARDWDGAARVYRELIRRAPRSAEAASALVSLAQIELGKLGAPGKALRRFEAYLSGHPRGPLALEALYGKARALRALGRKADERAALERFLQRFPRALQAGEARRRLAALASAEQG
jgi:ferric-dicitrate binding protein FerR (iron transport regulator)